MLTKAKELLEIIRNTVMIPRNLAGELNVGLICLSQLTIVLWLRFSQHFKYTLVQENVFIKNLGVH